jgi:hypothetical protein
MRDEDSYCTISSDASRLHLFYIVSEAAEKIRLNAATVEKYVCTQAVFQGFCPLVHEVKNGPVNPDYSPERLPDMVEAD